MSVRSIKPDRRQSRTLLTIGKRGSKIARNSVFDCHLSPIGHKCIHSFWNHNTMHLLYVCKIGSSGTHCYHGYLSQYDEDQTCLIGAVLLMLVEVLLNICSYRNEQTFSGQKLHSNALDYVTRRLIG